jgi:hypothetical protein
MKKLVTLVLFLFILTIKNWASAQSTYGVPCSDLFFSEYVEPGVGFGGSKVIEIYNPNPAPINMSGYKIGVISNGNCAGGNSFMLPPISINPGDVYVINNGGASGVDPAIVAVRDTTWSGLNFNGNDAVYLLNTNNGDTLDIFGEMCVNPGSSWQINTLLTNNNTINTTLIRNPNIYNGEKNWMGKGMYEWTAFPTNTFSFLGSHTAFPCGTPIPPTIVFDSTYAAFNENSGTVNLPLHVMFANSDTTKVDIVLMTGAGTATSGVDYNFVTQTVVIPPYWNGLIDPDTLQIVNDLIIEPTEDLYVQFANPQNVQMTPIADDTLRVDILDDDVTPSNTIQFLAPVNNSILEQAITLQIPVVLNASSAGPYTADVSLISGLTTATAGVDYNFTPTTLTFVNAQDTQYVALDIYDECVCELLESIQLLVSNPSPGVAIGIDSIYTLDILPNDAPPTVTFGAASYTFNEGQLGQNIPLNLSAAHCDTMYITVAMNLASNYVSGSTSWDFSGYANGTTSIVVVIPPGQTTANIGFDFYTNASLNMSGIPQTFSLDASYANCQSGTGMSTASTTVTVNDINPTPSFSMQTPVYTVGEGGGSITITVDFTNDYNLGGSVYVSPTDITAVNGLDYSFAGTTLNFGSTDYQLTVTVPITQDLLVEPTEMFNVGLSNASPYTSVSNTLNVSTVSIIDDDIYVGPTVSVNFAQPVYSAVPELNMVIAIPVVATGTLSSFPLTLDVNVDMINTTATLGSDFIMTSPTSLSFVSANDTQYVQLSILDECVPEFLESIVLTMSNPVNVLIGQDSVYYIDILQNDPTPSVSFSSNPMQTIGEAGGMLQVPVFLSNPHCDTVSVSYTIAGSAILPADYSIGGVAGSIVFYPGDTIKYITVSIFDDILVEPTENIVFALSNPVGAMIGSYQTDVVSIIDNDVVAPSVYLGTTANTYLESAGTLTVPVMIQNAGATTVSVTATLTSGSATVGTDVTGTVSQTIIFPIGSATPQNVTFTIVDDAIVEGTENFTIVLTNAVNATIGAANTFTGTIQDNDNGTLQTTVQLQSTTSTVKEGQTFVLNIPVYVTNPTASPVSVAFTVTPGTCLAGSDYVVITNSPLVIPAFNTVNNQINILDDNLFEMPESFSVSLSSPQNATLGALTSMQVTVLDNDFATGITAVQANNIKVYPSPISSNGILTVEREQGSIAKFQVLNLMGQIVVEQMISAVKEQVNLDGISAGAYVYRVVENGVISAKGQIVVEK